MKFWFVMHLVMLMLSSPMWLGPVYEPGSGGGAFAEGGIGIPEGRVSEGGIGIPEGKVAEGGIGIPEGKVAEGGIGIPE